MTFPETKERILHDFLFCVEKGTIPTLGGYLPSYLKRGATVSPDDYRLFPITATALGCLTTSSDCLTDCMMELQAKYEDYIPDEFGGRTLKGWREIGVVGFDVLQGMVLDILEIERTTWLPDWAEGRLGSIDWGRLLVHAVVDFGRYCGARQVRLQPAREWGPSAEGRPGSSGMRQLVVASIERDDDNARALKFGYDKALDRFVFDL
jgi:hypothetical protein